ncbi:MAG: hypothetical protein IPQ07_12955 [Myxococcales bacterium]|nr:hypothetical protein [Myxococcales bacterium]
MLSYASGRAGDRDPLGRVTLSLAVVERPRIAVPRRRAELRPFVYGAAVLVVHLVVWAAAMLVEPIERHAIESRPRRGRTSASRMSRSRRRRRHRRSRPPRRVVVARVRRSPMGDSGVRVIRRRARSPVHDRAG